MKKLLSILLLTILTITLAACSDGDVPNKVSNDSLSGEINVSCYIAASYQQYLEEAAAAFEAKNPGVKVNIDAFSKMPEIRTYTDNAGNTVKTAYVDTMNETKEIKDYISRINSELMGGQGADILAIDVLPGYRYADSDMLEDMSVFIDADESFDISDYRSNIIDAFMYKGALHSMPMDFGFDFITFDGDRVGEEAASKLRESNKFIYSELIGLIKERIETRDTNERVMGYYMMDTFNSLFKLDYEKFIDIENKKANLESEDFINLLNEIERQDREGYFVSPSDSKGMLYYYTNRVYTLLSNIFNTDDDSELASGMDGMPREDEIAGILVNNSGNAAFWCNQVFGINANSENKELAWEFIKFMLSEEMQMSLNLYGLPVNNNAFAEKSKVNVIKSLEAYDRYIECLNNFADSLNYYPVVDETISNMVTTEVEAFFSGDRTAEETAAILQNKVQLYLSE